MIETVVENKQCKHCQQGFDITQPDLDFYNKVSPIFAGQKFPIPSPTLCPDCRQRRRLSFRNERALYRRICNATGKNIISIYSPDKPYTVYDQVYRWSDQRDPMDYRVDFDYRQNFTENFQELLLKVPLSALSQVSCEGCDYTNLIGYSKNSYLCFACAGFDTCIHCHYGNNCTNILDSNNTSGCHYSYQLIECRDCYNVLYGYASVGCSQCIGVVDCRSCSDCINCKGLENEQYMIDNVKYSKEEYEDYKNNIVYGDVVESFLDNIGGDIDTCINSQDSTGKFITDCNHCIDCSYVRDSEDCKNVLYGSGGTDIYDSYAVYPGIKLMYDSVASIDGSNNIFSYMSTRPNRLAYCFYCDVCSDCFGCVGLKGAQYCIFNRQYTKEEYEKTVAKIITHMISTGERGEFFHPSLSPFGYNETVAQEYYPVIITDDGQMMDQKTYSEDVKSPDKSSEISSANLQIYGYQRSTYEAPTPQVDKVIKGQDLPDNISEINDDILKLVIECEVSGKPFKIIPQELAFYRKHNIPLPRKHPDVRHLERMELRR